MDRTNISVTLDDAFFDAYNDGSNSKHGWARRVYSETVKHMVSKGEPGFTIDVGSHSGEVLRNACTEITSADDSDVCNLGHLVLPRFGSLSEWREAIKVMTMFLTAGSMYSDMPYEKVGEVRTKNRRLGLGIIGVHEFLMRHGVKYGSPEAFEILEPYMVEFSRALEYANEQQHSFGVSTSVGSTAFAPTGTTGIIAESTPSADALFSAAEIRSVVHASPTQDQRSGHVVVDPTAARLVREGINPSSIEDAYTLAYEPERRFAQQAYIQKYTDHAVSMTVNLPAPIKGVREAEDFGDSLMKYLPDLRGITCYPNGAIVGQPRKPVDLGWALEREGTVYEGSEGICIGGESACSV
jgi:ribonucleoside-diphosphate reductase alpha chain